MTQAILAGIFGSFDERIQVATLQLERKEGTRPEYTITLNFHAAQSDITGILKAIREKLQQYGWQLTVSAQVYQESVTNLQGYIQPIDSAQPFESQYLSVLQEQPRAPAATPTTGGAK